MPILKKRSFKNIAKMTTFRQIWSHCIHGKYNLNNFVREQSQLTQKAAVFMSSKNTSYLIK